MKYASTWIFAAVLLACVSFTQASVFTFKTAGNETTTSQIRQDLTTNTGSANRLWAGSINASGNALRSLISFDLSTLAVPPGEVIQSVTLDLVYSGQDGSTASGAVDVAVYQLTETFTGGQASWANRATGTPWTTAGGTYNPTQLSLVSVPTGTSIVSGTAVPTFGSTAAFVDAVDNAAGGTFQIILLTPTPPAARQFANFFGDTSGGAQFLPTLTVTTGVPEPGSLALLLAGAAMIGVRRRRKA